MSDDRTTAADIRKAGMCMSGFRYYCERNGLDHKAILRDGMSLSELRQIDNAMARRVLRCAEDRLRGEK